jgi:hypothetical protein
MRSDANQALDLAIRIEGGVSIMAAAGTAWASPEQTMTARTCEKTEG